MSMYFRVHNNTSIFHVANTHNCNSFKWIFCGCCVVQLTVLFMLSNLQKYQNKLKSDLIYCYYYKYICYHVMLRILLLQCIHTCITTIRYTCPVTLVNNSYINWVGTWKAQALVLCLITNTSCGYCKCLSTSSRTIQVRHYCTLQIVQWLNTKFLSVNPHFFGQKTGSTSNSYCSFATTHNLIITQRCLSCLKAQV